MPKFKSYSDVLHAVTETPEFMQTRRPGNLTKAKAKKWRPLPALRWDCACWAIPGTPEANKLSSRPRFYWLMVDPDCKTHARIKGNYSDDDDPNT